MKQKTVDRINFWFDITMGVFLLIGFCGLGVPDPYRLIVGIPGTVYCAWVSTRHTVNKEK